MPGQEKYLKSTTKVQVKFDTLHYILFIFLFLHLMNLNINKPPALYNVRDV